MAEVQVIESLENEAGLSDGVVLRHLANYRELVARVVDVFGDESKASTWLSLPNVDLNGEMPLQVARKDGYDLRSLEPLLTRIEHGIYH